MKTVKIENWSIVDYDWEGFCRFPNMDEFRPFLIGFTLHGRVFGHPRIEDGHRARTTKIRSISGNIVTTMSETVYELGEPFADYMLWLDEQIAATLSSLSEPQ